MPIIDSTWWEETRNLQQRGNADLLADPLPLSALFELSTETPDVDSNPYVVTAELDPASGSTIQAAGVNSVLIPVGDRIAGDLSLEFSPASGVGDADGASILINDAATVIRVREGTGAWVTVYQGSSGQNGWLVSAVANEYNGYDYALTPPTPLSDATFYWEVTLVDTAWSTVVDTSYYFSVSLWDRNWSYEIPGVVSESNALNWPQAPSTGGLLLDLTGGAEDVCEFDAVCIEQFESDGNSRIHLGATTGAFSGRWLAELFEHGFEYCQSRCHVTGSYTRAYFTGEAYESFTGAGWGIQQAWVHCPISTPVEIDQSDTESFDETERWYSSKELEPAQEDLLWYMFPDAGGMPTLQQETFSIWWFHTIELVRIILPP